MHKLINENYVSTKNQKGKQGLYAYLPEEVANSINHELPKHFKKRTPIWTREDFHKVYGFNHRSCYKSVSDNF